ncbi:cystathionine beta-synthase [Coccinella septempunctata]|uniref:cystathionine beta-synthase n=1 Tax=Coccinella septempunctata TaxID=41139 RepID=UPI001D07AA4C|nr:cystathionine beta-synthase [Coccinella septempunctata]
MQNNTIPSESSIAEKLMNFRSPLNEGFKTPDKASACTWHRNGGGQNPHRKSEWKQREKILPNILHAIGNTPMVRLSNIMKNSNLEFELLAKCEFFNPGGSVKDRIAYRIVEDAEKAGILKPGATIIEPTSGNTGIGLALAAAVKGYRCVIVISEKMSNEKVDVLKALGAEVVRTPISASSDSAEGLFGVTNRLKNEIPNSIILDQYSNPGNPLAHYDTTAEEILHQCDGKIDMIVLGTGTGGTMTGIGRKIKEKSPNTIVVGVDPEGSILAQPEDLNKTDTDFYEVEGIGYDFLPTVLDRNVVDRWVKINDKESLPMARRLIKEEGILSGGSSGAVVAGALKAAGDMKKGQRVVVLLPDSIRNYITKFVSDHWMESKNLQETVNTQNHWWWDTSVTAITMQPLTTAKQSIQCFKVLKIMKMSGIDQIPIVDNDDSLIGVVTMQNLLNKLIAKKITATDEIASVVERIFPKIPHTGSLGVVSRTLERESFVVVVDKNKALGIITAIDLLQFIATEEDSRRKTEENNQRNK